MEAHRYRATVAYDGTNYYGFQRLPSQLPSIQAALEAAIGKVNGTPVTLIGAGRTDTGVHASGQVVAFDLAWKHSPDALLRAINVTLPIDIAIQHLDQTRPDFHPRFDALSRTYCYAIYVAPVRQPLVAHTSWHIRPPLTGKAEGGLNLTAMQIAASQLIGVHDFASFGSPPETDSGSAELKTVVRSTIRHVFRSEWKIAMADASEPLRNYRLEYTVEANAFLYHMVRSMVGTLVEIGLGRLALDDFLKAFQAKDRRRIGFLAPPHGLTLIDVKYAE